MSRRKSQRSKAMLDALRLAGVQVQRCARHNIAKPCAECHAEFEKRGRAAFLCREIAGMAEFLRQQGLA